MHIIFLNFAQRFMLRLLSLTFTILILVLIFFNVLPYFTDKTGWLWGLLITYILSAYLIFPLSIRFKIIISRRQRIPKYTLTPDGLPIDPVNLIFIGNYDQLLNSFINSGWYMADEKNIKTIIKFVYAMVFKSRYRHAPFSNLYLFGRRQDFGLQKAIGDSPRQRHHVRFWAIDDKTARQLQKGNLWHHKNLSSLAKSSVWVGAATEDIGFGYRKDTWQLTHAVDKNANKERDYIIKNLKTHRFIKKTETVKSGQPLGTDLRQVNHFISDGCITIVTLK